MAKSVLDAGWGMLKTQIQYKGQQAGRSVFMVDERNTTRTCSSCRALTGPTGLDMLNMGMQRMRWHARQGRQCCQEYPARGEVLPVRWRE